MRFLVIALVSLLVIGAEMAVTFALSRRLGRHSVVDVTWGLTFVGVAVVATVVGDAPLERRLLVLAMVGLWGLRLATHIALRSRGHGEDPRYAAMLDRAPAGHRDAFALRRIYLLQGGLAWFISLPVQANAVLDDGLGVVAWLGVALWAVGLFFEGVGDLQLTRFKADEANAGTVMDRGLWRYTRHPNYFGDACVWFGVYLVASHWPGCLTLLSPVTMAWFLTNVSGKKLLESRMAKTRPGYADYVARTSGFIPLPPKRQP